MAEWQEAGSRPSGLAAPDLRPEPAKPCRLRPVGTRSTTSRQKIPCRIHGCRLHAHKVYGCRDSQHQRQADSDGERQIRRALILDRCATCHCRARYEVRQLESNSCGLLHLLLQLGEAFPAGDRGRLLLLSRAIDPRIAQASPPAIILTGNHH